MREKVNVFYYPEMISDHATLKKSILLFDEIHFMDRPSFTFGVFGTIGMASPLRQYEKSFRDEGVPLYVHAAPGGPVGHDLLENVRADINDREFLDRFQRGLNNSKSFRDLQIPHGNYGEVGNHESVAHRLLKVDLTRDLSGYASPMDLFFDDTVRHFEFNTPRSTAKNLVSHAVTCSTKINFALHACEQNGLVPLADAAPYGDLLGAKYARATKATAAADERVQLTDLSFAIFDELVSADRLGGMNFKDVVQYRQEAEKDREVFLEHLSVLRAKQANVGADGDYAGAIKAVIVEEIIPAAREFKQNLDAIYDKLYGGLGKSALGYLGASAAINIFGDLSWPRLLQLAGLAGAAIGKAAIDARQAVRAAKRECAVSYVLSLDP